MPPSPSDSREQFPTNLKLRIKMQCVFNEALKQILVQMQSRKSHSLCCVGFKAVGQLSMLLTQAAWHIALISSRTDAFVPKQTQMQPATSRTRLKNILNLVN